MTVSSAEARAFVLVPPVRVIRSAMMYEYKVSRAWSVARFCPCEKAVFV